MGPASVRYSVEPSCGAGLMSQAPTQPRSPSLVRLSAGMAIVLGLLALVCCLTAAASPSPLPASNHPDEHAPPRLSPDALPPAGCAFGRNDTTGQQVNPRATHPGPLL